MSPDHGFDDFVAALEKAEPSLSVDRVRWLARGTVIGLARKPQIQRAPHPTNIFGTVDTPPDRRRLELHARAKAIAVAEGIPVESEGSDWRPNSDAERHAAINELHRECRADDREERIAMWESHEVSELKLATVDGEPAPERIADEWRPPNISDPAMWPNPANMPAGLRGLAFVDFDPSLETPPPTWLAKGLLPRSGIGLLFGESGAGKSFAAIHAALAVAWGLPLFDTKVKQGAVLYVAAEGGKSVVRRFRAANNAFGGAVAAANLARPSGSAPVCRAGIRVVHEAPDLSRDGDAKPLLRTIESAKAEFAARGERLALVVIDTWHAAMGGGDENSAADAGHALKPLIAASESGDFLTLIVHHPGKDSERGARGSNSLPAAADAIIAITVPGFEGAKAKPSSAMRQATVTKMRDGEAGGGFNYRLGVVPIGTDEDGDIVTTCIVEPCDAPKLDAEGLSSTDQELLEAVRAAIAEAAGERCLTETVRLRFYAGRSAAKESARRMAWQRALKRALEAGRLVTDDHSLFLWLPEAPEQEFAH